MAHRNFDEYSEQEGHTFTLCGEEFHTIGGLPVNTFLDLDEDEERGKGIKGIVNLVHDCLVSEDRERFLSTVRNGVAVGTLMELHRWILSTYADRPTSGPDSSLGGPMETENSSEPTESATDTTGEG